MSVVEEFQLRLFFGCSFTLLLFSITSIALTEQTDSDVWGRSPIAHVNGGYEGVIVAIHKNVPQERLRLDKIKVCTVVLYYSLTLCDGCRNVVTLP